ncbi:MAG: FtsX-like permease family protein [Tunicatimonas sp.]
MKKSPPTLARRFLHWFCRDDYLEEIEGNLLELYDKQYEDSPTKARQKFIWNVLRHFRPAFIRSFKLYQPTNHRAMIRHNLILTFRNFKRYKSTFLINLIGLSSGLACALLIYLWVNDELSVDKFHENDHQLYQAMLLRPTAEGTSTERATPFFLAETLADELPEVAYAVATTTGMEVPSFTLSIDDKNVKATGLYAAKEFFKMFSYGLVQGDANQILADRKTVAISEGLATKLFNTTENVIGRSVTLQHDQQYLVSGIFKDVPPNSSDQFEFVLSFEVLKDLAGAEPSDWGRTAPSTFVLVKENTDLNDFKAKIAGFIQSKDEESNVHVMLRPYSDRYLYNNYENGVQAGGRIEYVRLFSIIALFILVIGCINFMNLSTAKASRRLKEIGIKKAIGANRSTLVYQYLGESLLMASLSLVTAMLLVALFLPQFNQITGKQLALSPNVSLILSGLGVTIFTGLMAGSYPALYLSGFNPVAILKGGGASGKRSSAVGERFARQGLVVFQFVLSVILIVSVLVVYQQIEFVQSKSLGYSKDNVIYFEIEGEIKERLETFLAEVKNLPGIINVSSTTHRLMGEQSSTTGLQWPGKHPDDIVPFEIVWVNYGMIETLGIEMVSGRTFSRDFSTDSTKIIFNEAAIAVMGLTNPVGQVINRWGTEVEIVGVAQDFHFQSFHESVKPLFFMLAPQQTDKVMVKIEASREREAIEELQTFYQAYSPGITFDYKFLDQDYQALYAAEQRVSTLSKYFAGIAILISCLGLFGLVAFTAERRLKEIGIRKALGASAFSIVRLLSYDFTKLVVVAIGVALPLSYFFAQRWLDSFAFRIDLQWWHFIGTGVLVLLIAWLIVGLQTLRAARVNPVDTLRNE